MAELPWRYRSSLKAHSLMVVIICEKYGKNWSKTICALEKTRQDLPYFSSFTLKKLWLNDLEDIGPGQQSLYVTHPLIICAWYGKSPLRAVGATAWTWGITDGQKDRWTGWFQYTLLSYDHCQKRFVLCHSTFILYLATGLNLMQSTLHQLFI